MVTHDPRAAEHASRRLYVDKGVLVSVDLARSRGMKYFPSIWAGLWRNPVRSVLTLFSIIIAFVLFGALHGVTAGIDSIITSMSDTRLRSRAK